MPKSHIAHRGYACGSDTYAPSTDLPAVDNIALWRVAVAVALGLVVFTFAAATLP